MVGRSAGWHRAQIVAAIHMRGTSLAALARANGLCDSALRAALGYPRTPSNKIIAAFLGEPLHVLWPHWFATDGTLIVSRPKAGRRARRASSPKRNAA